MEFADLRWPDVDALLRSGRAPVLLLPLGAVEPHGPHAPLSTDLLISVGTCRRAADRLADDPDVRLLVLPPVPYGVTRYAAGFSGAVGFSEQTLHGVLVGICTSLLGQGFRYVVVVNNHFEPEHVRTIHRALDEVESTTGCVVGFCDLTRSARARRLTEEFRSGACHGGQYETSLVLAERPDLVDVQTMRSLPAVPVSLVEAIGRGVREFRAMGLDRAYCGSPAHATAEEGEATFAILAEMLVETVRALTRGTGGRDRPGRFGG
ncbi:MAG: creatininase family protein [Armatimonadota bacterium]|nr:creatininase family protein [Armatimonadota bacterium]MDR5696962.1 creatininase family protein [Armatimonadota bacterium]